MPTEADFIAALDNHVLEGWFPRSIDTEFGGFLCDFDRAWRSCGPHCKLLEFQARQTLFAAEATAIAQYSERTRRAAEHGFHCLKNIMWDEQYGGWFHRMDRQGNPLEASTKHTHGMAYAIQACAVMYESTGEPAALELAQQAFNWIDDHAHDHRQGGYFGFLRREGIPIHTVEECPWPMLADTIDTPIGYKDLNTSSDLLEAFTVLYRVAPTEALKARLEELVEIISTKLLSPSGSLAFVACHDWTPVSHLSRFGTECQTVHRLLAAAPLLQSEEKTQTIAKRIMEHVLAVGWDHRNGGIFYAGPTSGSTTIEGYSIVVPAKAYWVQVEGLRALLALGEIDPIDDYSDHAERLWEYIAKYYFDSRHGGMYPFGMDQQPGWRGPCRAALAPSTATRKGSEWKDASHDGRVWLYGAFYRGKN
ncbi:MAG: AGE family epimerase/isomerase [Pseudomonadota bacterium]|nr:AGE family epimerase/isomerase [Pseudomonadota bacterium]